MISSSDLLAKRRVCTGVQLNQEEFSDFRLFVAICGAWVSRNALPSTFSLHHSEECAWLGMAGDSFDSCCWAGSLIHADPGWCYQHSDIELRGDFVSDEINRIPLGRGFPRRKHSDWRLVWFPRASFLLSKVGLLNSRYRTTKVTALDVDSSPTRRIPSPESPMMAGASCGDSHSAMFHRWGLSGEGWIRSIRSTEIFRSKWSKAETEDLKRKSLRATSIFYDFLGGFCSDRRCELAKIGFFNRVIKCVPAVPMFRCLANQQRRQERLQDAHVHEVATIWTFFQIRILQQKQTKGSDT